MVPKPKQPHMLPHLCFFTSHSSVVDVANLIQRTMGMYITEGIGRAMPKQSHMLSQLCFSTAHVTVVNINNLTQMAMSQARTAGIGWAMGHGQNQNLPDKVPWTIPMTGITLMPGPSLCALAAPGQYQETQDTSMCPFQHPSCLWLACETSPSESLTPLPPT